MNDTHLRALYGLKYNPFLSNVPVETLWVLPGAEPFAHRIQALVSQGGFALITGDPGQGKSKTLQWIAQRLRLMPDLVVGIMERPQSKLADFYRKLGELFGVGLTPLNCYGSFKALCGDQRLPERFRAPDLIPLGSRIRARLQLSPLSPEQLREYLCFSLEQAGNAQLMTEELIRTLAAHSVNNLRVLNQMASELLDVAAERNLTRMDESLFFEVFQTTTSKPHRSKTQQPARSL